MRVLQLYFTLAWGLISSVQAFAQPVVNVALLMPFCTREVVSNPNSSNAELGKLCREYYQGMRIALDSLQKEGKHIRLTVYDTRNDSLTTLRIIQKQAFKESNLIIGPVLQGGNKMLTPLANEKKIYHVSPLMTFSKTRLNDPYWISANPNLNSFASILNQFIVQHYDSAQVLIISDKSSLDKNIGEGFKTISGTKQIKFKTIPYTPNFNILEHLHSSLHNILILPTANEQLANGILYQIKDTSQMRQLSCIGFQQWFEFKNADIEMWQHRNVTIASTFFVDYSEPAIQRFIEQYRNQFNTEPSESAFKGYDQAMLLIGKRCELGNDFMDKIAGKTFNLLQTPYLFQKQKSGAFHNNSLNFIRIGNDGLERVAD